MSEHKLTVSEAKKAFKQYLLAFKAAGYSFPSDADIDHSTLLDRLLNGKQFLPEPPPLAFSYPMYSLAETGSYTPHEVLIDKDHNSVVIDQSRWQIVQVLYGLTHRECGPSYVVKWQNQQTLYKLEFVRELHILTTVQKDMPTTTTKKDGWKLTKYEEKSLV